MIIQSKATLYATSKGGCKTSPADQFEENTACTGDPTSLRAIYQETGPKKAR